MIRESAEENNELVVYKEEIQLLTITSNLWSCTFQTAVGYLCLDLVMAITLHFVQLVYLDQSQAANGVGLAYTIMMMLIMPISLGLNQSLNLHAARALGMNKIQLSRNYLNLTMYIHLVYYFPFCFLIYLLKDSFKFLIMDNPQETIDYAWQYLVFLVVSCVFANQFEAFKAYMIACKVYTPFIVIHIITTSLHWIYCYILIVVIDLKIQGACYAILITEISNCVLLSIYFMFSEDQKHLSGLTFKFQFTTQFNLLKSYIKSSFHLVIHIYADLFCFFALTALAVALSTNQLAAQIIFSNFSLIYFRFPFSLSLALLSYIGSEMPQNNIQTAKKYAGVGMALFLVYLLLFCSFTWIFQSQWAAFYAPGNQEIQYILLDSLPFFLIVYMFFDGAQVSISGILKGILKAEFVTISTLISYYVFGIPFISYLMYDWGLGLGIKGIWIGFGLANAVLLILYIILCFTTNWKEQANLIQMKITKMIYWKQRLIKMKIKMMMKRSPQQMPKLFEESNDLIQYNIIYNIIQYSIIQYNILIIMAQLNKFIKILLHCLENEQNNSILCWGEDDCGFQIVNLKEFKNLIFREFHIRNITSFVRQANLYGFKIRRNSDNKKEYHHPKFRRNSQDLIYQIQRVQKSKIKPNENDLTLKSIEVTNSQLYADLQQLKIQQNLMHREIELNFNIQKQLQNNTQLLMKALILPYISNAAMHITLIFEQFLKITGGLLPEFVDKITKFIFEGIYIDPQILYSPLPFV